MRVEGHSFNLDSEYGYKAIESSEALTEALGELYIEQVIPEIEKNGLCATVLTQVSDVEDEINGLLTYDRRVVKVEKGRMNEIADKLFDAFEKVSKN